MRQTRSASSRPLFLLLLWIMLALLGVLATPRVQAQDDADPPGRVGRIAVREGSVWWFDDGQQAWSDAQPNLPLTGGDRVASDPGAWAELRIGSTALMLSESSELVFDRLDDEQIRIRVVRGNVALLVRTDEVAREIWLGTDDVWLQPLRAGRYRLQREGAMTEATSWGGELQLADSSRLVVDAGRRAQLWREGGEMRIRMLASVEDAFATRVLTTDRSVQDAAAARYVSPETTGYEDLDRYGRWEQHPEYGPVWYPLGVAVGWAPYRDGRWVWVSPWGWTWVDAAPWGFAPFHYGRWMQWRARWVWVPGPYVPRPVWAPALVTWIEGPSIGIGIRIGSTSLSWMPLAPWEPLVLGYRTSPRYRARIEPPQWYRYSPPPGWKRDVHPGRGDGHHGVTVIPATSLRPPPPPVTMRPRPMPIPSPRPDLRPEPARPLPPSPREHEWQRGDLKPQVPHADREAGPSRLRPPVPRENERPLIDRGPPPAWSARRSPGFTQRPPAPQAPAPAPSPAAPVLETPPPGLSHGAPRIGPGSRTGEARLPGRAVEREGGREHRPGFGRDPERLPERESAPSGARSIEQRPDRPPATRGNRPEREAAR